jgi:hypothetical protein
MKAVNDGTGGFFIFNASGRTGKKFLISLILITSRSQNGIVPTLTSSGISAMLIKGSRTAHSVLKLPLNIQINETSTWNLSRNSTMVLQQSKLIV